MKRYWILLATLILMGCGSKQGSAEGMVELAYKDFGPPSLAEPLLGNDFWQWQAHGDSRPRMYPIGVIVYRNVDLANVKRRYPVVAAKERDYRYVSYDRAMIFLNEAIAGIENEPEGIPSTLVDTLKKTRAAIAAALGN